MKVKSTNKAFTLIELLAVIVILAIIALIATPVVLNIIKSAKESATKRSAENYVKAVETAVVAKNLTSHFDPTTCEVSSTALSCAGYEPIQVDVEGEKPTGGSISFANHKVNTYELVFGNQTVRKTADGTITLETASSTVETYTAYANGTPIGFNVTTGEECNVADAVSTTNTKNGCMKFYAFNDSEDSSTVNLLLDHNTTDYVAWNSNVGWANDGEQGPGTDAGELLNQLHADTDNWNGTVTPKPNTYGYTNTTGTKYDSDWNEVGTGYSYNIDYSGYKARLISADEIAQITGNDGWTSATGSYFYLDTNTSSRNSSINAKGLSNYKWLFDRTSGCESYGCANNDSGTYGYWTSSASSSDSTYAWYVSCDGNVDFSDVYFDDISGLRPVITVSKSKLSQ